jgi:hypothetical protein
MTHEPQNELANVIRRYASDPVASRQLQRHSVFALPPDSTAMFQGLLEKLNQTERAQAAGSA